MTRLIDKELANEVAEITNGKTKEELIRLIEKQAVIIKQLRSSENEIATDLQPTCDQIVINSESEPVDISDNISRQAAIYTDGLDEEIRCEMCKNPMRTDRGCDGNCKYDEILYEKIIQILNKRITPLPSAQPEWNNHTVACLLADMFGDSCACNHNGIDEWLPGKCELLDSCPHPVGVACWEQFLKHRAERKKPMDDTISRKAAIKWVKTECNPYGKPTLDFESGKKVIEHLERMPSAEPEWIPCDERMPYVVDGTSGAVLVTCGSKNVKDTSIRWVRRLWFDGKYWNTVEGKRYNQIVYAWMPQPHPYNGGEKV